MRIRILSWNIHKGIGGVDRRYRLERVIDLLRVVDPDVVLLQEVADHWPAANRDVQVERLQQEVPIAHFAFSPEHRFRTGGYGNAVLSKFPIVDQMRIDLKIGWRKQRSALQVCIQLPEQSGHKHLFATSLHLGLVESERRKQLTRLFEEETHHRPSAPSILAGDFNDVFNTVEKQFTDHRGYRRLGARKRTFPAVWPCFSLDAIFGVHLLPLDTQVPNIIGERAASDHLPLIIDCEIA